MPKKTAPVKKRSPKPAAKRRPKAKTISQSAPSPIPASHQVFPVSDERKWQLLLKLLRSGGVLPSLVFVNSKDSLENLERIFERGGLKAERLSVIKSAEASFPLERVPFLLGTDQDAKAIAVTGTRRVFNYDPPASLACYQDRMRSLASCETPGAVMSLCLPGELAAFDAVMSGLGTKIELVTLREFAPQAPRPVIPAPQTPLPQPPPAQKPAGEALTPAPAAFTMAPAPSNQNRFLPPLPARVLANDLRPIDDPGPSPKPQAPMPRPDLSRRQHQPAQAQSPSRPQGQAPSPPRPTGGQQLSPEAQVQRLELRHKQGPRPRNSKPGRQDSRRGPRPDHGGGPRQERNKNRPGQGTFQPRQERPESDVKSILRRAAAQKPYVTGHSSDLRPKKDRGKYGSSW